MTTVVRAGTSFDGTGADPKRNVTIHVEGDAIARIGGEPPRDATVTPQKAEAITLVIRGGTVAKRLAP